MGGWVKSAWIGNKSGFWVREGYHCVYSTKHAQNFFSRTFHFISPFNYVSLDKLTTAAAVGPGGRVGGGCGAYLIFIPVVRNDFQRCAEPWHVLPDRSRSCPTGNRAHPLNGRAFLRSVFAFFAERDENDILDSSRLCPHQSFVSIWSPISLIWGNSQPFPRRADADRSSLACDRLFRYRTNLSAVPVKGFERLRDLFGLGEKRAVGGPTAEKRSIVFGMERAFLSGNYPAFISVRIREGKRFPGEKARRIFA